MKTTTKLSIKKLNDYTDQGRMLNTILDSIDSIGGIDRFFKRGDKVLIKPNLLNAKPIEKAVITHPDFIYACANIVKEYGATPIVADSPPLTSCAKIAHKTGLATKLKHIGVEMMEFTTPIKLKVQPDAVFKDITIAKEALDVDCIINLPKIKTHSQMVLTAAVKNMYGTVIGKEKALWHLKAGTNKDYFARMLIDLYLGNPPALTIADSIMIMEGNGPSSGEPRHVGAIIASDNGFAIDAVACDILRIPFDMVYTLKHARHLGITGSNIEDIEIIGDYDEVKQNNRKSVKLPVTSDVDFGLPWPIKRLLRNQLTTKPVIDIKNCKYCKECEKICPAQCLKVSREEIIFDYDKCIKCFCCQEICEYGALKEEHGSLLKLLNRFK